jgi:hypothetical protein
MGYMEKEWLQRKQRTQIGRMVYACPVEGERYYLFILLNHVRGATSFDDLKTTGTALNSIHNFLTRYIFMCDEDIHTSVTIIPSVEILGHITRSRAQQLNHQVNSFLCSSAYNNESRLLPNNSIVLRNKGEDHGGQMEHQECAREPRRCA